MSELLRRYRNECGLLIAILVVAAVTAAFSDAYHSSAGLADTGRIIARESALVGIFALGAAVVIISGGIDLSAGSVIAFSGMLFFGFLISLVPNEESTGWPNTDDIALWIVALATLGTLAVAVLIGSFHAWLITVIRLPPFVATLASLVGLRSLARLLVQDITQLQYNQRQETIGIADELLTSVARENWWITCVIWLVLCLATWILLSKTTIGRHLYAMGGNEEAARLSGIRTERLKWLAYCISSVTAAISGILYACYITTSSPASDGMGYELNAIAAAVVGGCSLTGGVGTIAGVILGTVFLRLVIDSVAKLFKSQPDIFEGSVVGALVILAVALNELRGDGGFRKRFFPGALGILNVGILTSLAGVLAAATSSTGKLRNGLIVAATVLVALAARAIVEMRVEKKRSLE
ncbi:MAG: ABC transporter permease [Planctomycetales bacterium]|nr:ABC transporter permease [Planctomycetales bacterium]